MPSDNNGLTLDLAQTIEQQTGQNPFLCYQCVKCSSGCPLAEHMDLLPNQVMRAVQMGDEMVLAARTPWLCAACQTCTTRCPQQLDVAAIMDALRIEAKKRGLPPAISEVDRFNRLFLRNIGFFGRIYEPGLVAGRNLTTGRLTKDIDMGLAMLKRRKLKLSPTFARPPKKVAPVAGGANKMAYYPGCSLHGTAPEYEQTVRAVAGKLDLELIEPPGWTCCGASAAHATDPTLAALWPMRTLATVEQMGLDTVTAPCSACFARLKTAARSVAEDDRLAAAVAAQTGYDYQGRVMVQHLLDTVVDRVGLERVKATVEKPLTGLKVACYYGCLITRPPEITQARQPDYPLQMDDLITALGGQPVDWSYKTDCCGGSLSLTQTELALEMSGKILQNAHRCGADLIAAACPLCHLNLDARQAQIDLDHAIPVLYITQLMALAFGLGRAGAVLAKNLVDPGPVLDQYNL